MEFYLFIFCAYNIKKKPGIILALDSERRIEIFKISELFWKISLPIYM